MMVIFSVLSVVIILRSGNSYPIVVMAVLEYCYCLGHADMQYMYNKNFIMVKSHIIFYRLVYPKSEIYLCELCESSAGCINLYHINFYRGICYYA